tara:strand:+ start:353 stop:568 length:216 start_codon:yes stop_codon:yes gene_type:complete
MNKSVAIIVGGTDQFGRILIKKLIKKNYKVVVTTRSLAKAKLKVKSNKKTKFLLLIDEIITNFVNLILSYK